MRGILVIFFSALVLLALGYFAFPKAYADPCVSTDADGKCLAVATAIGDISTDPASFAGSVFSFILGISGGIALILIIISGYNYMTSHGDPEKVKSANERLTSTIIGLLFIVLSFTILRIIGVDILRVVPLL